MADFIYQEPFEMGEDTTQYRLLTKDYVTVEQCGDRQILRIDPKGLELLSKEAMPTYRSICAARTSKN